jgi:hypothetical protein
MRQLAGVVFPLLGTAMAAFRFPRLRRAGPHPWGLATPSLDPVVLGGESWDRHGLIDITLVYGDPLEVSAPLVEITTRLPGRTGDTGAPHEALAHLAHRDAAVQRRDWLALDGEPTADPPGPVLFSDAHLLLGGQPHPVNVLTLRPYQAAQFTDATTTAGTIASRHCPLDQLTLAPVPAIEPYLAGYTRFLRRMGQHVRTSPRR